MAYRLAPLGILAGLAAALAPVVHAAVGRTVGAASVSQAGEANYGISIWAPPGTAGMTPKLSLSYGHRSGGSLSGQGWGVGGLSAITRCGKTWAQDGQARAVKLDAQDRFCLNGNQLKLVSGTYGSAASVYATELETFARITAFGVAGSGPAYFSVETKDGLVTEYGNTSDSRIESIGSSTARAWLVNKTRDRSGNYVAYNYTEDTTLGSYRINNVQYTGNSALGVTPTYQISFTYETQPANEVEVAYLANSLIKDVTRMTRVDVTYNAALVHRYNLAYEANLSSASRSRLASITECAGSAGTDCFAPTTFTYQNGTNGYATQTGTGVSAPNGANVYAMDVNGDGRTDLVFTSSGSPGTGTWKIAFSNGSGYNAPINTGIADTGYYSAVPIDYNADGLIDLMVPYSGGTWWVLQGTTSGFASPINTGIAAQGSAGVRAIDVNGDGLDDVIYCDGTSISYRPRVLGATFGAPQTLIAANGTSMTLMYDSSAYQYGHNPDFDGDGRDDFSYTSWWYDFGTDTFTIVHTSHLTGPNTDILLGDADFFPTYLDLNGDGLTDMAADFGGGAIYYRFSTGSSMTAWIAGPSAPNNHGLMADDWDGDGYDDLLIAGSDGTWKIARSTGQSLSALVATGVASSDAMFVFTGDVNGDGLPDPIYGSYGSSGTGPLTVAFNMHLGVKPDLMTNVTDGFGNSAIFTYTALAVGNYTKSTDAVFPYQDYQGGLSVVSQTTASNGIGGTYTNTFLYYGAKINLQGRGFVGFGLRRGQDSRTGIWDDRFCFTSFPYTGMNYTDRAYQSNWVQISEHDYTVGYQTLGAGYEARYFPYVLNAANYEWAVGGSTNGALMRSASMTNSNFDSTSGEFATVTSVTKEEPYGNGLYANATWTQTTTQTFFNDTTNWCLGRAATVAITSSHSLTNGGAQSRNTSSTWDGQKCRASQTKVQPGTTLEVKTDIGYDSFGNVSSQTVTGYAMTARTNSTSWGSDGHFPVSTTNALSQTSTTTYNYTLGVPASQTNPNGMTVSWAYDNFGRKTQENRPDGTYSTWTFNKCTDWAGACYSWDNNYYRINQYNYATNGTTLNWLVTFHDPIDRMVDRASINLVGQQVNERWIYNALGQLSSQSTPARLSGGEPFYYASFSYDLIGRQTQASRPISSANATLQYTTTAYNGLTTVVTDAQGKIKTTITNAAGQVVRSADHAGYYQQFGYDAFGNAVAVTDLAGVTLQTAGYNIRGMRTSSYDADMGSWTYSFNALGEMTSHTDANAKTTSYSFDALSRPLTRVEPAPGGGSITREWYWGANSTLKNVGQLQFTRISGSGLETYYEDNYFDSLGRPSLTNYGLGASVYSVNSTFNSTTGLLDSITYPTTTSGYRHQVVYEYMNGQPWKVRDSGNTVTYWQANAQDSRGNITDESLGNGLRTTRSFDAVTGLQGFIRTGPGGGSTIQNLNYAFDLVGNLSSRNDAIQSLTEAFNYDNLYRLTSSTLNSATNFSATYAANGNLITRGDVGGYTYHATKIHAVTAAGGFSYGYDANGNVTLKNSLSVTWYTSNLPQTINNGSSSSSFEYTPSGQYWKQVANGYANGTETTKYIGGLLEIVQGPTVTSYRHYIKANGRTIAIYSRGSNGTNTAVYPLTDHVGSTETVTDASGAVLVRESFAAFGARRGSNWQGTPSSGDMTAIGNASRRGYTDHSMLDNVGLIHMNGRVFDPAIGRFLSADPNIDGPAKTGGWNRYSYVQNNPLSFSDPSGFFAFDSFDNYTADQIAAMSAEQMDVVRQNEIFNGQNVVATAWQEVAAEQVWQNMTGVGRMQVTYGAVWGIDLVDRSLGVTMPLLGFETMDFSQAEAMAGSMFLMQATAGPTSFGAIGSPQFANLLPSDSSQPRVVCTACDRSVILAQIDVTMAGIAGKEFDSATDAARAIRAGTSIAAISYRYNIEIGVQFMAYPGMQNGHVIAGNPVTQFLSNMVNPISGFSFDPAGDRVAYLHTHGAGSSVFSYGDAASWRSFGTPYLLTPFNGLRVLDIPAWLAAGSPADPNPYSHVVR